MNSMNKQIINGISLVTTESAQAIKLKKGSPETDHTYYLKGKDVIDLDSSALAVDDMHHTPLIRVVPNAPVSVSANFEKVLMALPKNVLTSNSRGRQLNLGVGVMTTNVSGRLPTPKHLKSMVGPESQRSAIVPYELTAHRHRKAGALEALLKPIVLQMQNQLSARELLATEHQVGGWQGLYGSCWDKINISVSDGDKVPFTNVHFDSNNRGRCAILLLGEFTGGEQLVVNGRGENQKAFRIATHSGDLFVADYHRLRHAALPVTSGRRIAIICYSSRIVHDYLVVQRHWETQGGLLEHVCAPARKRQRVM